MENQAPYGPQPEDAHARNLRIHEEMTKLREQSESIMDWAPDFADYWPRMIGRMQEVYSSLLAAKDAVLHLGVEGVVEVTLRSRTQTLTWAVDTGTGGNAADVLLEHLHEQLWAMETKIVEARAHLAGSYGGATAEEWHHQSARYLALLLDKGPTGTDSLAA